jgi:hypothetical protein
MSVGFPVSKNDIDLQAGQLAIQVRDLFVQIDNFRAFLDTKETDDLVAMGYNEVDNGEVTLLKSAITQLSEGGKVLRGLQAQPEVNDFLHFSNLITGIR